jgi:hypothetical protein
MNGTLRARLLSGNGLALLVLIAGALAPASAHLGLILLPVALVASGLIGVKRLAVTFLHPLSPRTWSYLFILVCFGAVSLLVLYMGPAQGVLPYLPSDSEINSTGLLSLVAVGAFLLALGPELPAESATPDDRAGSVVPTIVPPIGMIWGFAILGVAGLLLTFHSFGAWAAYYRNPSLAAEQADVSGATQFLSLALRPFLVFAGLAYWSRHATGRGSGSRIAAPIAIFGILFIGSTFSFNRASIFLPLLGFCAAYARRRRVSMRLMLVTTLCAGVAVWGLGVYRSAGVDVSVIASDPVVRDLLTSDVRIGDQVQVYGGAPQFTAFLVKANELTNPTPGSTLLSSLLYPVPMLGREFRASSGPALYNQLIYGTATILDQIIPFPGEVFINYGYLGVAIVFAILGFLLRLLNRAYWHARNPLEAYIAFYGAAWLLYLFPASLSAVAQVLTYFCWPIVAYACWRFVQRSAPSQLTA